MATGVGRPCQIEPWDALLASGREDERLVQQSALNARAPQVRPFPADLHPDVERALLDLGLEGLWSHQAEAYEAAAAGR